MRLTLNSWARRTKAVFWRAFIFLENSGYVLMCILLEIQESNVSFFRTAVEWEKSVAAFASMYRRVTIVQLRSSFLLHDWNGAVEYSNQSPGKLGWGERGNSSVLTDLASQDGCSVNGLIYNKITCHEEITDKQISFFFWHICFLNRLIGYAAYSFVVNSNDKLLVVWHGWKRSLTFPMLKYWRDAILHCHGKEKT